MDNQNIDLQVAPLSPVASDDSTTSVGAALAAGRVAKGWAVEDIARMLKLSVVQVAALEAGDHSRLPAGVFVRGFIRTYARLVNVELAPALPAKVAAPENIDMDLMHRRRGVAIEPNPYRRVPAIAMGILSVILGLAYFEFVLNAPGKQVPFVSAPSQSAPQDAQVNVSEAPYAAAVESAVPAAIANAAPLILKKSNSPSSELSDALDKVSGRDGLHFVFNGNSWVEVRDRAGKVVYSKSNPSGTESLVRGDPPLSVVVGAASVVKLSYNGSPVDLAMHATADVARLRLE
jgi:cytoskeleton protein RodZ